MNIQQRNVPLDQLSTIGDSGQFLYISTASMGFYVRTDEHDPKASAFFKFEELHAILQKAVNDKRNSDSK